MWAANGSSHWPLAILMANMLTEFRYTRCKLIAGNGLQNCRRRKVSLLHWQSLCMPHVYVCARASVQLCECALLNICEGG